MCMCVPVCVYLLSHWCVGVAHIVLYVFSDITKWLEIHHQNRQRYTSGLLFFLGKLVVKHLPAHQLPLASGG